MHIYGLVMGKYEMDISTCIFSIYFLYNKTLEGHLSYLKYLFKYCEAETLQLIPAKYAKVKPSIFKLYCLCVRH